MKPPGRWWWRSFSPLGSWTQVARQAVQAALRQAFTIWGRPQRRRVDNGPPWGSWNDLPPDLALWAIGLGIAMHWNRPRHCQENGKVERSHGVRAGWVEPATCPDVATLQTRLTAASRLQREVYPALRGQARSVACPALGQGGRPYAPAREAALFDAQRVWRYLAGQVWTRQVDKVGRISLYNRPLGVGRASAGHEVAVRFDPTTVTWTIQDAAGRTITQHPAPELSRARIRRLDVSQRRQQANPHVHPPRG